MRTEFDLDEEQIVAIGETLGVGQQTNVNHDGCPSGQDTKKRLYVKRTQDGNIIAFCHHCGGKGARKKRGFANALKELQQTGLFGDDAKDVDTSAREVSSKEATKYVPHPDDVDAGLGSAPREIVEWFVKTGVTFKEAALWGCGYSTTMRGYVMPVNGTTFQVRLNDAAKAQLGCRYLTYHTGPDDLKRGEIACWFPPCGDEVNPDNSEVVVVVEDCLSAIKLSSKLNVHTVWALGTNNQEKVARAINTLSTGGGMPKYRIYIMFDNDKPDIIVKASDMAKHLMLATNDKCRGIQVCNNPTDPKHMRIAELKKHLEIE